MDIFTRKRLKLSIIQEITRRMNLLEKIYTKYCIQKNHKHLSHFFQKWNLNIKLQKSYEALEETIIDQRKYLLRKYLLRLYWQQVTLGWHKWKWYSNYAKQMIYSIVRIQSSEYKRLAMKKWHKMQQKEKKEEQIAALAWIFFYRRAFHVSFSFTCNLVK
jgi:hypothetical protein